MDDVRRERDLLQRSLIEAKQLVNTSVEDIRELTPEGLAMLRDEYDLMLACLVQAQSQITLALDQIDNALARQAKEE